MRLTTSLSSKALLLRQLWQQEKPEFYQKIQKDYKAIEIINALAEMIAGEMSMNEIKKISF